MTAHQHLFEVFRLLEDLAGPQHHGRERVLRDTDVEVGDFAQQQIEGARAERQATLYRLVNAQSLVVEREPDWNALPPKTPPKIRELIERCLGKDPNRRPADIRAVAEVIETVISVRKGVKRWPMIAAAAAIVVAIVVSITLPRIRHAAAGPQQVHSILVLPFENQSHDPNSEYLSDGIAEGLISSLAALPDVRVVARTTAFRFKGKPVDLAQIRKQIDVDAIVAGRLLSRSGDVIVQADLIDAGSGTELWGSRFQEQSTGVLNIEHLLKQLTHNRVIPVVVNPQLPVFKL